MNPLNSLPFNQLISLPPLFRMPKHNSSIPSVFLRSKFIYIHIPKCAGMSVVEAMFGYQLGHKSAFYYQQKLGYNFNSFFKFALIRDPVHRFRSAWNYILNGGSKNNYDLSCSQIIKSDYGSDPKSFVKGLICKQNKMLHFQPQSSFISFRGNPLIDLAIPIENFERYIPHLRHNLPPYIVDSFVDSLSAPPTNTSTYTSHQNSLVDIDDYLLTMLYDLYRDDYEILCYAN